MRNLFKTSMLFAAAAIAFVGCAKDGAESVNPTPEKNGFHLNIAVGDKVEIDGPDVRTEYDPEISNIKWSGNEIMQLYVNQIAYTSTISMQTEKPNFPVNIASITTPGNITIQGILPASAVVDVDAKDTESKTISRLKMQLLSEQNGGTINTFDPAADILVVQNLSVELTQEDIDNKSKNIDNFLFGRPMAISKYTFITTNAALSADELVESVQISVVSGANNVKKYLTGRFYYAPSLLAVVDKDGNRIKGSAPFYTGQAFDYVKTTYATQPKLSELIFWFVTAPVTLEAGDVVTFTIETNKHTIVKTSALSQSISYTNRQLNTSNVKINENNTVVTEKTPPATGETATLTEAEMQQIRDKFGSTYANFSFSNSYGEWSGKSLAGLNKGDYYLQINTTGTNTATGSYILTPEFNGAISQIELTLFAATSNPVYLNTSVSVNNPIKSFTGSNFSKVTFDLTDLPESYSKLYIVSGGSVMINNIDVIYTADTTPKVVVAEADQTIALPYSDEEVHTFKYTVRNGVNSDVTVSQDKTSEAWLEVNNDTDTGTVKYLAEANTTNAERTATITLAMANGNSVDVTIKQAAAPKTLATPDNLNVTVDGLKASASWTAVDNATEYAWRLVKNGVDEQSGTASEASVDITGLSASTSYTFYVKAVGNGTTFLTSAESNKPFATQAVTIPQLTMSDISIDAAATTSSSLTAKWTAVTGATGYKYKVTSASSEVVGETTTTGTSVVITGLEASTEYTISVLATGNGVNYLDSAYKSVNGTTAEQTGPVVGAPWSHTFNDTKEFASANSTANISGLSWTLTTTYNSGSYFTNEATGMHIGSGSSSPKDIIFSTSSYAEGIQEVGFRCQTNDAGNWTATVTVGGTQLTADSGNVFATSFSNLKFTAPTPLTGDVVITIQHKNNGKKNIYIQALSIN